MRRRSLGTAIAFLTFTRLVVNTAHRFVFPFLPAISRGLGISLEQGGLLMSAWERQKASMAGAKQAVSPWEHGGSCVRLKVATRLP